MNESSFIRNVRKNWSTNWAWIPTCWSPFSASPNTSCSSRFAVRRSLTVTLLHHSLAARLTRVSAVSDRRRCWSTVRAARGLTTCRRRSPQSWASWRLLTTPCTWSPSRDTRWGVQSLLLVCFREAFKQLHPKSRWRLGLERTSDKKHLEL